MGEKKLKEGLKREEVGKRTEKRKAGNKIVASDPPALINDVTLNKLSN